MEDGALCCCEYFDIHEERNHILACCCNCEDLDVAFDRLDHTMNIFNLFCSNIIMKIIIGF